MTSAEPIEANTSCGCILLDLGVPCDNPADVEFVMGCVHEHLEVDAFCGRHQQLALGGELVCTVCLPHGIRVVSHALSADPVAVARLRAALTKSPEHEGERTYG